MDVINLDDAHRISYLSFGDIHQNEPIIFLHGIMGNKNNVKSFVQMLLEQCEQFSALIFDLRNHGQSTKHWQSYTVQACANDIDIACRILKIKPKKIIGHSFGGKVAFLAAILIKSIEQVWLLDCPLGAIDLKKLLSPSPTVLEIIDILSTLDWPMATRKSLVEQLTAKGVDNTIALWMTTNLVPHEEGLYLIFSLSEIKEMLLDFSNLDCWSKISSIDKKVKIHEVVAERGQRFSKDEQEKWQNLIPKGQGFIHVLKNSGHFVHIDNPHGLLEILKQFI